MGSYAAWLADTFDRANDLQARLDEAESEIKRHHELIVKMRDSLRWSLDFIMDYASKGLDEDEFATEMFAASEQLLKREVG